MVKQLIEFTRRDECPCCRTPRAIECYDIYNNPINYSYLLNEYEKDKEVLKRLNRKILSHMKCKSCGKTFKIYWDEDREIPIPLNKLLSKVFFDKFLEIYK